jgi:ribosomal protein S18 acetylase RimI-like enzyme
MGREGAMSISASTLATVAAGGAMAISSTYRIPNHGSAITAGGGVDVTIRSLDETDFAGAHDVICRGFSTKDFQFNITAEDLNERLVQNGYDPRSSLGAFVGDAMIGVWLAGMRIFDGARVAYCAGTAVLQDWRRVGIAQRMLDITGELCTRTRTKKLVLTTFTNNDAAINLYEKNGFYTSRSLVSYRLDDPSSIDPDDSSNLKPEDMDFENASVLGSGLLNYEPSWRNSWQSLKAIENSIAITSIRKGWGGKPVAYGVYQPLAGRIAQLGISMNLRTADAQRTLHALLSHFRRSFPEAPAMEIVEIPKDADWLISPLVKAGFEQSQDLIEMVKEY